MAATALQNRPPTTAPARMSRPGEVRFPRDRAVHLFLPSSVFPLVCRQAIRLHLKAVVEGPS